jgi:hypothetical protein
MRWKPQCSEMSSWSERIEERRGVWVKKEIVKHFSCNTISLKHSSAYKNLISSIIDLLRRR